MEPKTGLRNRNHGGAFLTASLAGILLKPRTTCLSVVLPIGRAILHQLPIMTVPTQTGPQASLTKAMSQLVPSSQITLECAKETIKKPNRLIGFLYEHMPIFQTESLSWAQGNEEKAWWGYVWAGVTETWLSLGWKTGGNR